MKLLNLSERSLHMKSMLVDDGPILPPSTSPYGRQRMRRQINGVTAKSSDTFPNSASATWDIVVRYRFLKKDGNPAEVGGDSFVFRRGQQYEPGVDEVVKAFLKETRIEWHQIEP